MIHHKLTDDEAWQYTQALGALATARYQLNQVTLELLDRYGVGAPFQVDGNTLIATPKEETDAS